MAVTFESYERRIDQIKPVMEKYGIKDFEDALEICKSKGFNPYDMVKENRRGFTSFLYSWFCCR